MHYLKIYFIEITKLHDLLNFRFQAYQTYRESKKGVVLRFYSPAHIRLSLLREKAQMKNFAFSFFDY